MAHSKKKVDVRVTRPFNIGFAAFAGFCPNIVLSLKDIVTCLENKAYVSEVLRNGTRRPLDFANYDKFDDLSIDVEKSMPATNPEKANVTVTTITKSDAMRMQNLKSVNNGNKHIVVDAIQNLKPKNDSVASITAAEAAQAAKKNEEEKKATEAQTHEEKPSGQVVEQTQNQNKKDKHNKK